jgi:N-acetylglucosamine kinase-like BadF-type ATPase
LEKIIIDSGGTKANWAYLKNGSSQREGTVPGIHPFFLTETELAEKLQEIQHALPHSSKVQMIFHYGTGTNSRANLERLHRAYRAVFPQAETIVESDLLAVARALCGHQAGIAAILGTGSNVGRYDGKHLVKTAGGLGYALGDEGGGAYLGKHLLNHFLNGLLPPSLHAELQDHYQLSRDSILEAVYRKPFPNRYLASVAPFLGAHLSHPYITQLVQSCFRDFFRMNVLPLQANEPVPLSCGGSIAFHFATVLRAVAKEFEVEIGEIAMSPMEGLVRYHAG